MSNHDNSDFGNFMRKIIYEGRDEICYDFGDFRAKQKKNKYGQILEKVYLYSKDSSSYYWITAFATFSSMHHLEKMLRRKAEPQVMMIN